MLPSAVPPVVIIPFSTSVSNDSSVPVVLVVSCDAVCHAIAGVTAVTDIFAVAGDLAVHVYVT